MLAVLPDPIVVVGTDGTLLWGNDVAERTFGFTFDEMAGRDMTTLVHPDDLTTAMVSLASVQEKDTGTLIEIRVRDHAGTFRWVELRGRSSVQIGGVDGVVLSMRDLTDRRRWQVAAGDEEMASVVFDALPTIALVLSAEGRIESANRSFTRVLGHPLEDALGRPLTDFVSVAHVLAMADQLAEVAGSGDRLTFEADLVDTAGTAHPMSMTLVDLVDDGAVQGLVATATDISALADARDRLAHAATHDDLTGLPNRMLLHERLEASLSNAAFRDLGVGVVFADLDDFRIVNDTYGHTVGDQVLVEVGNRLSSAVRDTDLVARYGGDEFVLVAAGLDHRALGRLVDRLSWLMRTPVTAVLAGVDSGLDLRLSLSVGAVLVETGVGAAEALGRADAALQRDRTRRRRRHA